MMRNHGRAPGPLLVVVCAALTSTATAQAAEIATDEEDRTLSPYFHVQGEAAGTDALPLKETRADVTVSGVIAHVRVTQIYENEGKKPLEAVYVFPGSTRSAVFAMRMKVGERTIEADIEKKAAARKIYEKAKSEGKSASLLEQKRPNVFQMNVANIMPGDTIKVQLDYVEALRPEDGVYEFVYPTVVGPRYSEKTALGDPGETWIENPHLQAGEAPPYAWDLRAKVHAGMAIEKLSSPSHEIQPSFKGKDRVRIDVDDPQGGDRDFVLRYRLSGGKVQTGMLLYPGQKENFFLAMVQPPERVKKSERPPREYVFILDVSGSMHGFPLDTAKEVMKQLLGDLGPRDRFNMMMFSGGSTVLAEQSLPATPRNVQRGLRFLARQRGGGGTRIRQALEKALAMKRSRQMSTSFVVVTDGYVAVEKESFDLIRKNLGEANLFAFGIGSSVNRFLIEGMARAGMGEPFVVLDPKQAPSRAKKFQRYIESPVLTDVEVAFDGFRAYDVVPKQVPDLFARRPLLIFGKYRGKARGRVRVSGRSGGGRYRATLNVAEHTGGARHNQALRYLWARHKIRELGDYRRVGGGSALQEKITRLGLRYSLMTEFTSFVAVDKEVRNEDGELVAVRQPLPMPKGVPNSAVGGSNAGGYGGIAASAGARGAVRTRKHRDVSRSRPALKPKEETDALSAGADADDARAGREARHSRPYARAIRRAVSRLQPKIEKELAGDPKAGGRLRVELVVGPKGKVRNLQVLRSTLGSKRLGRMIIRALYRLKLPATGKTVRLRHTVKL